MTIFREKVLAVVRGISRGATMTYAQVACLAGNPRACRAVGSALKANYDPAVPCHRVIRSDGTVGNYNRGATRKAALLCREGARP